MRVGDSHHTAEAKSKTIVYNVDRAIIVIRLTTTIFNHGQCLGPHVNPSASMYCTKPTQINGGFTLTWYENVPKSGISIGIWLQICGKMIHFHQKEFTYAVSSHSISLGRWPETINGG